MRGIINNLYPLNKMDCYEHDQLEALQPKTWIKYYLNVVLDRGL